MYGECSTEVRYILAHGYTVSILKFWCGVKTTKHCPCTSRQLFKLRHLVSQHFACTVIAKQKKQVPFSISTEHVVLMHAWVFTHTLFHGNSKIDIRERNRERKLVEKCENEKN